MDFAWPEHRLALELALEYEGNWHGEANRSPRIAGRLNRLTGAGWRLIFVTAADLRDPERLIERIRKALALTPRFVQHR